MPKHSFIARLRRALPMVQQLGPQDYTSFDLDANYGHYRITIGTEYSATECRRRHIPPRSRPIQIEGDIDHLFIEPNSITAQPLPETVAGHLKATVVIQGVRVHISDPDGDGRMIEMEAIPRDEIDISQTINMAGKEGQARLQGLLKSGQLTQEAYRIIQEDVIRFLRKNREQLGDSIPS
jgi:hypothetical protein